LQSIASQLIATQPWLLLLMMKETPGMFITDQPMNQNANMSFAFQLQLLRELLGALDWLTWSTHQYHGRCELIVRRDQVVSNDTVQYTCSRDLHFLAAWTY
jgi:hypothetical protein